MDVNSPEKPKISKEKLLEILNPKSKYSKSEVLDAVSTTSLHMITSHDYRFYYYVLSTLKKHVTMRLPTAGVSLNGSDSDDITDFSVNLFINPNFFMGLSSPVNPENNKGNQRLGLMVHEMLHIVLRHITGRYGFADKILANIAMDMCINQYIKLDDRIEGGVYIEDYIEKGLPLEKHQSSDYYYRMLQDLEEKHEKDADPQSLKDSNGNPIDTQGAYDHHKKFRDAGLKIHISHDGWKITDKNGNDVTESHRKAYEDLLDGIIKEIYNDTKNMGIIPAGLESLLEDIYKPSPDFAWKRMLRIFANNSKKTFLKTTMKKRSKRYGTIPGIKIKRKQHLMVAIDTSGSVPDKDLSEFFGEIYHIYRAGATITIVECDAAISKVWEYKGKTPQTITGRGGTDFNEPIDLSYEMKPDGFIYFTDGECTVPQRHPKCPTIWIVTSNGQSVDSMKEQGFKGIIQKMEA